MVEISFVCNGEKIIKKMDLADSDIMPVLRKEILNGKISEVEVLRQYEGWNMKKLKGITLLYTDKKPIDKKKLNINSKLDFTVLKKRVGHN